MNIFLQRLWKYADGYKRMRIVPKMVLGYIMLVFLPVVVSGFILYSQVRENTLNDFAQRKQELAIQAANGMEANALQIESIYKLFQYNSQIIDYLNGQYVSDLEYVYHFLKDIRPLFSFIYSGNPSAQSVQLFKLKKQVFSVDGEIDDLETSGGQDVKQLLNRREVSLGLWSLPQEADLASFPQLTYYRLVYNDNYTKPLAILRIKASPKIIGDYLDTVVADSKTNLIMMKDKEMIYQNKNIHFTSAEIDRLVERMSSSRTKSLYWKNRKLLVNEIYLDNMQLHFYFITPTEEILHDIYRMSLKYAFVMLGLLLVLTGIYYTIALTLTKRIIGLAKHMKGVNEHHLSLYNDNGAQDEVGYLTRSYNSMIQRIDDLLNRVHKAEIMKKEAEYLALQAQVKPHFLYNTLESIRMMAEINNDYEVVEAAFALGKLMRYSLSSKGNESTLKEELQIAEYYLELHKLRLMDRLHYEIQINAEVDDLVCPRFIIQPLLENCINHGISKERRQGKVRIIVNRKEEFIMIRIIDNGSGIPEAKLLFIQEALNGFNRQNSLRTENSGMGLYNVSERIKSFFGEDSGFIIESTEGKGTTYTLQWKAGVFGVEYYAR